MQDPKIAEREWAEKALSLTEESFAILFDRAPVMMHSIDRDGRLVKVNRRWLRKLGYEREEVLGQKCIDFLTEESRLRALKDTLPVFWRVGSARSIGHRFVKKTGRVLDVLLDAEVIHGTGGNSFSLAALRDSRNIIQWHQASTTIRALREVIHVQRKLESVLSEKETTLRTQGLLGYSSRPVKRQRRAWRERCWARYSNVPMTSPETYALCCEWKRSGWTQRQSSRASCYLWRRASIELSWTWQTP